MDCLNGKVATCKSGFTLIELLIVIGIIVILVGVIWANMDGARTKAQMAAFKNETRGSYAGLANSCVTTGAPVAVPIDTRATDWAPVTGTYVTACSSNGKFTITAKATSAGIDCIATINESGVVGYVGPNCN